MLTFSLGTVLVYILQRFQMPTFLAFILTGIILGPQGLNLIQAEAIRPMAQIGIIFLLFIVGLDLSVDKLKQLRYLAPLSGVLQLIMTTALLTLALRFMAGLPWQLAFLLGSILSLSSTAIVLKTLEDQREIDSVHGRLILGILIIQDLSIILLMALVPVLTEPVHGEVLATLGLIWLKALLFGTLAVWVSLKLVPIFLDRLASTNQKEAFTLALVCIGLGMALLTHSLGLSYEAGAFVAGLALSRSVFCRQLIADSKGFRDVFITLFFVSMGLLFDGHFLLNHPWLVLGATGILILLKSVGAYGAVRVLKLPHKTSMWAAVSLFQVGEFSFVLLERTLETVTRVPLWQEVLALWSPVLVDAIIISMFLTPLVLRWYHRASAPSSERVPRSYVIPETLERRVIIGGYGPTARNLATALEETGVPYSVVEMNLKTVRKLQAKGIHCIYGDISRPEILTEAGIKTSGLLALTLPDIRTCEIALQQARKLNPNVHCLVRSRYRIDVDKLRKLGADTVVYEEFETSISFVFHIMQALDFPILETDRLISRIREDENAMFSEPVATDHPVFGRFSLLEGSKIEWIEVQADSAVIGKSLQETQIRQRTGVNIIAVIRGDDKNQMSADPDLVLHPRDVLVAVGSLEQLHALEHLLYG